MTIACNKLYLNDTLADVCVYFNSPDLFCSWYFLLTFMKQLFEDFFMKHQFGKYWFYEKEEHHPGTGDKSKLGNCSIKIAFPVLISLYLFPTKAINILCPMLFVLEPWFWASLLYLFIASHSAELLPHLAEVLIISVSPCTLDLILGTGFLAYGLRLLNMDSGHLL